MDMPVKFQSGIPKGREHRKRGRGGGERGRERERDLDVKWRTTVRWILMFKF